MSKLHVANLILQIFFIRIAKIYEVVNGQRYYVDTGIMYFVLPFTGWNTPYVYVGRAKFRRFGKKYWIKP